jgi:ubiquinone/menaquinone biosynthesis C-methylase UbiE
MHTLDAKKPTPAESRSSWVEADAQALPFGDDEFDVVTSSFGAIFAPDHQKVADEFVRVCRPGGTIGMTSFPPVGLAAHIFGVVAPYMPAPRPTLCRPCFGGRRSMCGSCSATVSSRCR